MIEGAKDPQKGNNKMASNRERLNATEEFFQVLQQQNTVKHTHKNISLEN